MKPVPFNANRSLLLTERVRRVCRLTPAEVAFLLAHQAAQFELLPTGQRQVFALTPGGFVGVVPTPGRRLVVRPKIPLANLFFLLDPLASCPFQPDQATAQDGGEALVFLAGQLVQLLRQRVEAGLQRGYEECATMGPFLRGRLDAAAQLRDAGTHKERLHSRHDAFTANILCNRVVKSAVETVLSCPLLSDEVRLWIQNSLPAFAEVQTLPLTAEVWAALAARPTDAYAPLLDLCRLLVESLTPGIASGTTAGPAFLLNLEQVFERYLTRIITQAIESNEQLRERVSAVPQTSFHVSAPVAGQPDLVVRPDVLLTRDGKPFLLVDAKWKRLGANPLLSADVYQLLAYSLALAVNRAVLVYPGRRDQTWHYDLEHGENRLTIRTLRIVGERAALLRSARRLTQFLLRE